VTYGEVISAFFLWAGIWRIGPLCVKLKLSLFGIDVVISRKVASSFAGFRLRLDENKKNAKNLLGQDLPTVAQ
jgi:hypothetical protein